MTTLPKPTSLLDVVNGQESTESLKQVLSRISEYDGNVNAFVSEDNRMSRLHRAVVPGNNSKLLHGALVGVKDIIRVDGLETRAGSSLPPGALGGPQATLINRLQGAGALVAGKTVTAEFAVAAPGPTRNPRDLARTPGGSSSGSAAAVAAGLVPLAIGTQTVGSIIRPAAYCGVVGFRPTWGAIPTDGVIANSPSLDTIGLFAADLDSIDLAAGVLCDWGNRKRAIETPPVLGVPTADYLKSASPEGLRAFEYHVELLQTAGYTIRRAELTPDIRILHQNLTTFQRFELAQVHANLWRKYSALYQDSTSAAILAGQRISPNEYRKSAEWRSSFRAQLASTMSSAGIDIWVTPSAPGLAPKGLSSTGNAVMSAPFSFAGLPAINLPAPNTLGKLPFGLQCVADAGRDQELIASARGIASALELAG